VNTLEYADLFLTESREHVAAVNAALLELERESAGPRASEAIAAIFRAVHTIKGMGATMGYAIVAELAHELETVLDRLRRRSLALDGALMDVLFKSADVLERAVEAAVAGRDGEVLAADLVAQLRLLGAATGVTRRADSDGWSVGAPDGKGRLVRIRLSPETPLRGVRAFIIVSALAKIGEIGAMEPSLDDLQAEGFDSDFALRLTTTADAAEIERVARKAGDIAKVFVESPPAAAPIPPPAARASDGRAARSDRDDAARTPESRVAVDDGRSDAGRARHVRIDVRRLDALMNLAGELVIARGRLVQLASKLGDASLEETVAQASSLINELRGEITASRMVPVSNVFDRFPRVVRDAARSVGKPIDFTIEGKDLELDRSMLDEIGDSIVHLLRNAIDHGIEAPAARAAAGKPPTGQLVLSAARDRSAIVIKVSDDGKGIDRARVLARAKRDGLVEASKTDLTEDELLRLLARPGFSTADTVTSLSGRGVGVDAVYTRVRALGGAMDIRSASGHGTTMILRLPLTLAIVRAVLARVSGETYAIPLAHVSETAELLPDAVRTVNGREVLLSRDDVFPLLRLRTLVGLPPAPSSALVLEQVVVIDVGDRRAALVIDELAGQEEIVVKPYDAPRDGLSCFAGATLLSDGSPSLIVDVSSLV
jgi:two-component system chemotaxis sensor kinase CheA